MKKIFSIGIALFFLCVLSGQALAASPTIASTDPVNNATGVPINSVLTIVFSPNNSPAGMDDTTINCTNCDDNNNIWLRNENTQQWVPGTVTYDAVTFTATFTPTGNLLSNTKYRLRIENDVKNSSNEKMASKASIYFTTGGPVADHTPPTIISVSPANGATGVSVTTNLTINFSEDMKASSITTSTVTLSAGATSIVGTVSYIAASRTATFTPLANLASNTLYTATVTTGVQDLANNNMAADYVWTFRTSATDTTPPTVIAVSPANNATNVSINTPVTATFSEPMQSITITTATVTLRRGATAVLGTVTYDEALRKAVFTPTVPLLNSTTYTATIINAVRDVAGNAMVSNYVWTFTTASATAQTAMTTYCQTPAFIGSGVRLKPNVLLIVDNSGSMREFAYKTPGSGGSTFDQSYISTGEYYGYFDTKNMYKYNSAGGGYFEIDTTKTLDKTSFWSGNFLNWLTMRRVDVVRKILVGGKTTPRSANTANYLLGTSDAGNDNLKAYGGVYYEIVSGTPAPQIKVCTSNSCNSYSGTPYDIKVYVGNNPPDEGIIIKMQDQIRFGIEFFNEGYKYEDNKNSVSDGGYIAVKIGDTGTNLVTQIENTDPGSYTPLSESLYEATRYFQASTGAFTNQNYGAASWDPIEYACQRNFVLMLTDGESTKDRNLPGTAFTGSGYGTVVSDVSGGNFDIKTWMDKIAANEVPAYTSQRDTSANDMGGSYYLEGVAYYAHMTDFRSATLGKQPAISGTQNLTFYSVFAFDDSPVGRDVLRKASKYGGFSDKDNDGKPYTDATCGTKTVAGVCTANPKCIEWDKDCDGIPDTYFEASSGGEVANAIQRALNDILAQVASGTATSILSSSEGSGATLMQAIFFPKKIYSSGSEVSWMGEVQNMWYFLDPRLNNSRIREDTVHDYVLDLSNDYIINSYYDTVQNATKVDRFADADGDGSPDSATPVDTISIDAINTLWKAGTKLWSRNVASSPRTLYTTLTGAQNSQIDFLDPAEFDPASVSVQTLLQAANVTEATKIINYTHGLDQTGYRSRNAVISGTSGIWKLADIVSSTPKVQSSFALNKYDESYKDKTYAAYLESSLYKSRAMAYVGANDGMLHAINFGTLDVTASGTVKAKLCEDSNGNAKCDSGETTTASLGSEQWAYIPKNALPYLKYLADPNYCHLYTVDLSPTVFDASIGTTGCSESNYWDCNKYNTAVSPTTTFTSNERWRTVLIGGMRQGGACKAAATTNGVGVPVADAGYSSYFALDVTNPATPQLLWEFVPADHGLGFSTSGPAILRINAREMSGSESVANKDKNGRWFAVFASGPTGPIDTAVAQFKGFSDQPLKLYVLDLKTGQLLRTIDTYADNSTPLPANAFGSALYNANIDYDFDYQDDVLYVGYTKSEKATPDATTYWTQGGVLRLSTMEDLNGAIPAETALNPAKWEVTSVMDNIGSVTSAIAHLAHYPKGKSTPYKAHLYFGTGRYFYNLQTGPDDSLSQRSLFGITDPCLTRILQSASCTSADTVTMAQLEDVSNSRTGMADATKLGWYIDLGVSSGALSNERMITDPLATPIGVTFFTTFAPSTDVCSFGGKSYLWAVRYDTGGTVAGMLRGKGLIQLSTGAIEEVDFTTAFSDRNDRRTGTDVLDGIPPTGQGLAIVTPPAPLNKILHIKKR